MKQNKDPEKQLEMYKILMNYKRLEDDWNLYYGITDNRTSSLLKENNHKNSYFNLNSENSLTLFVFCNLDKWSQVGNLKIKPRDDSSRWNKKFFESLRGREEIYNGGKNDKKMFKRLLESNMDLYDLDMMNSILLFEFGVMNSSFHNGETFRKLSFLDMKSRNRWVKYDAVLILPSEELFIFFESKMNSDISRNTSKYPGVNQIMKGLESAYLLTNHEDSLYDKWDFRYILTCPRIINEYNLTYYNYITKFIGKNLMKYNDLINKEYSGDVNESCYPHHFGGFVKEVRDKIGMLYWDELAEYLIDQDDEYFIDYLANVEKYLKDRGKLKAIKNRFKKANIKLTKETK